MHRHPCTAQLARQEKPNPTPPTQAPFELHDTAAIYESFDSISVIFMTICPDSVLRLKLEAKVTFKVWSHEWQPFQSHEPTSKLDTSKGKIETSITHRRCVYFSRKTKIIKKDLSINKAILAGYQC